MTSLPQLPAYLFQVRMGEAMYPFKIQLHDRFWMVELQTVAEAIRVTRPGGKLVFVDYHGPKRTNPLRYLMRPVLHWLEPFALDLWRTELPDYLPDHIAPEQISSRFYCGGLYQKVVVTC